MENLSIAKNIMKSIMDIHERLEKLSESIPDKFRDDDTVVQIKALETQLTKACYQHVCLLADLHRRLADLHNVLNLKIAKGLYSSGA